jgi:hypothetical protein
MNPLFQTLLVTHVVVAILGLGAVGAVPLVASAGRKADRRATDVLGMIGPLLRYSAISLGLMLVTGALLDLVAGGAFSKHWWFRGSALLLFVIGALHGQARRALRTGLASEGAGDAAVTRVVGFAYAMSALIVVITLLMEVKPFR